MSGQKLSKKNQMKRNQTNIKLVTQLPRINKPSSLTSWWQLILVTECLIIVMYHFLRSFHFRGPGRGLRGHLFFLQGSARSLNYCSLWRGHLDEHIIKRGQSMSNQSSRGHQIAKNHMRSQTLLTKNFPRSCKVMQGHARLRKVTQSQARLCEILRGHARSSKVNHYSTSWPTSICASFCVCCNV